MHGLDEYYKNRHIVFLTIAFFLILFGFSINGIDMRYPMLAAGFIFITFRNKFVITIPHRTVQILAFLFGIAAYSFVLAFFNNTNDYFEVFRFLRCCTTLLLISLIITSYKIKPVDVFTILKFLFLLNSVAVICCIIWPKLNYYLLPISRMKMDFMSLRSPGLTNGEDAAGFLSVCGIILEIYDRQKKGKGPVSIVLIIFLVSTAFTSRFTMLMASFILVVYFFNLIKHKEINRALPLLMLIAPITVLAVLFWILTTGFAMNLRESLLSSSPQLRALYNSLVSSYLDYGIYSSAVSRNISITNVDCFNLIFGSGIKAHVSQDSGYVKTIYSIGIIGLIVEVAFHLKGLKEAVAIQKKYTELAESARVYVLLIIIILAWEFKYSFMFSNTVFEILMFVYITMINTINEIEACNEYV